MENQKPKLISVPGQTVILIEDISNMMNVEDFSTFLTETFSSLKPELIDSENKEFVNDGSVEAHKLYPDTDLVTYIYCVRPTSVSYENYFKIVKFYFAKNEITFEFSNTVPVVMYSMLKENNHLLDLTEMGSLLQLHTDEQVEEGIKPLLISLMEFPGIKILESCEGHYDKNDPTHLTDWVCSAYVLYTTTSMDDLNILTLELMKQFPKMFQHFQLDDNEDWAVKQWFIENGVETRYGHQENQGLGTIFDISFKYRVKEQSRIFKMIEYLASQLHYAKV